MMSAPARDKGRMEEGKVEVIQSVPGSNIGPGKMKHNSLRNLGTEDAS